MTSVKALVFLHCAQCQDTVLHIANRCNGCDTLSTASGNPPVPRAARPYGYSTTKAKHYDAARAHQNEARRLARQARTRVLARSQ